MKDDVPLDRVGMVSRVLFPIVCSPDALKVVPEHILNTLASIFVQNRK